MSYRRMMGESAVIDLRGQVLPNLKYHEVYSQRRAATLTESTALIGCADERTVSLSSI